MPWITNVSYKQVLDGDHPYDPNTVLIRIRDLDNEFKKSHFSFKSEHRFAFLDVEKDEELAEFGISVQDAQDIIKILTAALKNNNNVLVHCVAGLCRSGAITEVGVMMGFSDLKKPRIPNSMVKYFLMRELGWTYDPIESPDVVGCSTTESGILVPNDY